MRTYDLFMVNDFSGGLNVKAAPMSIADNQATDLLNCEFDLTGALVKRGGYSLYNSTPVSGAAGVDSMIRFYRNDGTKTLIAAMSAAGAKKVYKGNDGTGTFSEITGGSSLDSVAPVDLVEYRDTLFISNGAQPIQYYQSGSAKADVSGTPTPPKGKYLAVCDNRLFVAGDSAAPNTVYFSGIALFSTLPQVDFPAENFINIPRQDTGDLITGMAVYRDELFIFRRNDIWALMGNGPEDYCLQEVNNRVGAVSHRAVANTGDSLVFVSPGHICEYTDGKMRDAGLPIESLIGNLIFDSARTVYYPAKNQVWITTGTTGAGNNRVLVFDKVHGAWSVFDPGISALCVFSGAGDSGELYGGAPGTGTAMHLDHGTSDNGAAIDFSYTTKHFFMRSPQVRKSFRRLYFNVNTPLEAGAFDVSVSVDFGRLVQNLSNVQFNGFNRWGEFVYSQAAYGGGLLLTAAAAMNTGMTGRYVSLTLSASDDKPLTVYSIGVQHKFKRLRGE